MDPQRTISNSVKAVLLWIILVTVLGLTGLSLGMNAVLPGPASDYYLSHNEGEQLAKKRQLIPQDTLFLVLSHNLLTIDDPKFANTERALLEFLRGLKSAKERSTIFADIQSRLDNSLIDPLKFSSTNRHHSLFIATVRGPIFQASETLKEVPRLLSEWELKNPDFGVEYLSAGIGDREIFQLINDDLDRSLYITIPLTLAVLCYLFGSVTAASLPLAIAVTSLIGALGLSAIISRTSGEISATANQLVVLLVLATGVDYSLFMISRVREEIRGGKSYSEAIASARTITGSMIIWSGAIVASSLIGLALMKDLLLTSMALVSIAAIFITVIGCVVVLPAVLRLLGPALEWGRLHSLTGVNSEAEPKIIKLSLNHPIKMLIFSATILMLLGAFANKVRLGSTLDPTLLPDTLQSARAFKILREHFPKYAGPSLSIVISGDDLDEQLDSEQLNSFWSAIATQTKLGNPVRIDQSPDGSVYRYNFVVGGTGNDRDNLALVNQLKDQLLPKHLRPLGLFGDLSGVVPYIADDNAHYAAHTPRAIFYVLALSFVFLLLAFRSIVIPIKAIILNLISTAAAFGALVICFQSGLIPFLNYGVIEGFVPPLLFSTLFGLSMDYHVLMLSRVQENVEQGIPLKEAVARAMAKTSRLITSAALIMILVFSVIATLQLPIMKQLGLGLAVAVFIDATLVRLVLLPASMVLLGRWNWYLPGFLRFIHHLPAQPKH